MKTNNISVNYLNKAKVLLVLLVERERENSQACPSILNRTERQEELKKVAGFTRQIDELLRELRNYEKDHDVGISKLTDIKKLPDVIYGAGVALLLTRLSDDAERTLGHVSDVISLLGSRDIELSLLIRESFAIGNFLHSVSNLRPSTSVDAMRIDGVKESVFQKCINGTDSKLHYLIQDGRSITVTSDDDHRS
jgi:hypothetical protein